ncbi:MAPEG family protein [Reinekea forsetii]|nr:MAPEG family protein [Reinekea forsetii]
MSLTQKQVGVFKGILVGVPVAMCVVFIGAYANPFGFAESSSQVDRLGVAILSCIIPAVFLAFSIGRLAKHRFFSPEDIDGGGLTHGTEKANILQSILQNTLEQTLLATLVYLVWSVVMPATWLSVVPIAALCFGVGRLLFTLGYAHGAPARALGFALTFFSSNAMLITIIGYLIGQIAIR